MKSFRKWMKKRKLGNINREHDYRIKATEGNEKENSERKEGA